MDFSGRCPKLFVARVLFVCHVIHTCAGSVVQRGIYHRDQTFDDLLPKAVTQWSVAGSALQCGILCHTDKGCNSFFYHRANTTCALQRRAYVLLKADQTVTALGFRYYRLTSVQCPNKDYVIDRLTSTCYRLVTSVTKRWHAARDACNATGEMLTVLDPAGKAGFLQDFLRTNVALHNFRKGVNTGGSRPLEDWDKPVPSKGPSFVWVTGQPLDLKALRPYWRNDTEMDVPYKRVIAFKRDMNYLLGVAKENTTRFHICERAYL